MPNKSQQQNNKPDSQTKVNFSVYQANRYFANQRQVWSFRADSGIWQRYKQLAKQVYGSICRGIEIYMVNFIEATERGVYFSHTERPINIEKIVIERNLRSRRKLEFEDEVKVVEDRVELPRCDFCRKPLVVARFRHLKTGLRRMLVIIMVRFCASVLIGVR